MKLPRSPQLTAFAAWCLVTAAATTSVGCANLGSFVWVDEYDDRAGSQDTGYTIVAGDVLNVRVWNQEGMSARARVRADGKISLPFLNDVTAVGYSPPVLAAQLQTRLKDFINSPVVTISLEEVRPFTVSVLGYVQRVGVHSLEPGAGLLQALATAGGFTDFAHKDRIFVLRQEEGKPKPTRIRFRYEDLARSQGRGAGFHLRNGDVVVVE